MSNCLLKTDETDQIEKLVKSLPLPLSFFCLAFCSVILFGYFSSIEVLYRPIPEGPATSPLTALTIFFLALSLISHHAKTHTLRLFSGISLSISFVLVFINVSDLLFATEYSKTITPFYATVFEELNAGLSNKMGINTSLMLMAIIIAQALLHFNFKSASQTLSFITIAVPTIVFTGYAYGLSSFYGQMSLTSSTIGFTLGITSLAMTTDTEPLKAILNPYTSGRVARIQTLLAYFVPAGLGFLSIKYFAFGDTHGFGVYVVLVSWIFIIMVGASAIFQERIELKQQQAVFQLEVANRTDPLTSLSNRRHFFEYANYELCRLNRNSDQHLYLMMLDIDHFKQINDTAGHSAGDKVLIAISNILSSSVRNTDIVARIGGEEFAILLTDTSSEDAMRVAEHIRQRVEQTRFEYLSDRKSSVTISIGIAEATVQTPIEDVLREADTHLYFAKQAGRNKIFASHIEVVQK